MSVESVGQLGRESSGAKSPAVVKALKATRSRRVLLVEEDPDTASGLKLLLEYSGYTVATAADGKSAMRTAPGFRPDVVVCDLDLQGDFNGHSLAEALRDHATLCFSSRVAVSGDADEVARLRARDSGFEVFLIKPVTLAALRTALGSRSI